MRLNIDQFQRQWLATVLAKLIIGIVLLVGAMSIFTYVFFPDQLADHISSQEKQKADGIAKAASFAVIKALLTNDKEMAERVMRVGKQIEDLDYMVVLDEHGQVYCSLNLDDADKYDYRKSGDELNSDLLKVSCPLLKNNQRIGEIYLGFSRGHTQAIIDQSHKNAAGIGLFFLVLGAIAIVVLRQAIISPVKEISVTMKSIAEGKLSDRIDNEANDEIGTLAQTLNVMIDNWETSRREWGMLNKGLEQRVTERTLELEEEINERKRIEEDLRLFMAKLERSNRELEDFAFVASHDLQEPLRKVQAFGDRLKAACGDELSEKAQTYLDRMQSAAERMQTLIKDLLTFSRVTSKAQPFVKVDINQTISEVLSDLEVTIEKKQGAVEVGTMNDIEADALQMRQLFQNIIGNALKFHKQDVPPKVKISSELIKGKRSEDGPGRELCRIVIEDNGIGFDEKYTDRIFTVFQRLHGRSEYEGTGLGLAVCRKIVERHGGTITAKSTPGEGSRFIIVMPVMQNESEAAPETLDESKKNEIEDTSKKLIKADNKGMETSFMVPCP